MEKKDRFVVCVGAGLVVGVGIGLVGTIKEQRQSIETLNTDIKQLEQKLEVKNKEIKGFKENIDKITKEKNDLNNEFEALKDITYNKTHYNPYNLMEKSGANEWNLALALKGTKLYDLIPYFIEAENKYGVNVFALIGLVANESSWGESSRAKRDNNLTGYAVYSNDSKGRRFSSKKESILETARLLKENYLSPEGIWFNGKSLWNVNEKYCVTPEKYQWANTINKIAYTLQEKSEWRN